MHAIYETTTGKLVSTASALEFVTNPLPPGLASKVVADPPAGYGWNPVTLDFEAPPSPRRIGKLDFIQRFTLAERRIIFTATLPASPTTTQRDAWAFLKYLDYLDVIDLDDAAVVAGVQAWESVGLIATGRAAEVLS